MKPSFISLTLSTAIAAIPVALAAQNQDGDSLPSYAGPAAPQHPATNALYFIETETNPNGRVIKMQ